MQHAPAWVCWRHHSALPWCHRPKSIALPWCATLNAAPRFGVAPQSNAPAQLSLLNNQAMLVHHWRCPPAWQCRLLVGSKLPPGCRQPANCLQLQLVFECPWPARCRAPAGAGQTGATRPAWHRLPSRYPQPRRGRQQVLACIPAAVSYYGRERGAAVLQLSPVSEACPCLLACQPACRLLPTPAGQQGRAWKLMVVCQHSQVGIWLRCSVLHC